MKTDVEAPVVTMVVPCWNQLDLTKRMVDSVRRFVRIPFKMVFINNGSEDGTAEYLNALASSNPGKISVIHNEKNEGFVTAMNQGMKQVKGHMLWLNNDVEFLRPGTLEHMIKMLEAEKDIGAIGPVSDAVMGSQMISFNQTFPEFHIARFLIGFCMLVKKQAWKEVGELDPNLNNFGNDDLDYSIRLRKAGWKLGVTRGTFIHHLAGSSWAQMFVGGYASQQFKEMDSEGRRRLIEKHGQQVVDELFLPVDFSGMRVLFAVPAWGDITPEAYGNHMGAMQHEMRNARLSGMEIEFAPMIRSAIVPARNELVRIALKRDCTHIFFMDDDMLMPPGALHHLIMRNLPAVSGLCHLRTPPHYPSMFMEPPSQDGKIYYVKQWPEGQTIKVDAVGCACFLIQTQVLQAVQNLEQKGVKFKGEDLWFLYGKARPGEHTLGEDIFFCKLVREAGFDICVDTSCEFGHIGPPMIYSKEYFYNLRNQHAPQTFPGVVYTDYEATHRVIAESNGHLTPEGLAHRMGGNQPEKCDALQRVHAGRVGDGLHPGAVVDGEARETEGKGPGGVI